ncbi:hypothetical protein Tco_0907007 [Tanacetum coccineum]|uniref:Uncharacterized protein n=1 Tax=Tanacetum coccineum TaxID=301880 RepID=A0ABQ5CKW7_9ASTR
MSNTNNTMQTQTSNALYNAIMEVGGKDRPPMLARVVEGSLETTTEGYMENYKNVSEDIRNLLNVEAEVVHIILTWIDNDIYSIVDACPNAIEMWQTIERLKQGESINVQDLETNLYWEFGKFTSRDGESLESYYSRYVTLVKQSQELETVSYHKLYDILKQHQNEVNEIRAERLAHTANPLTLVKQLSTLLHPLMIKNLIWLPKMMDCQKEKEIDKLMALISLSFKKIYKPTNNNLRTSSNTSRANQDNNQRTNKELGMIIRGHLMLLGLGRLDDTDDEPEDQELEAHYLYMEKIQEVTPDDADNSGPVFDDEPFTKEEKADQDDDGLARERYLLASLIGKLKCEIDDRKNRNKLLESSNKTLVDKLKSEFEDFKNKN